MLRETGTRPSVWSKRVCRDQASADFVGQDLTKTISTNATASQMLNSRLGHLRDNLVSSIAFDLSIPDIRKTAAVHLVSLLVKLDRAEVARDTFLKARQNLMMKRIRGIRAEGDISIYVSELAVVCFTIIRHTSDWYMNAFKENRMASGEQTQVFKR